VFLIAETKNYRVVYHLGEGVEAAQIIEAGSHKEASTILDKDGLKEFLGENETYFQFKLEEVKMISVHEVE
jgi:hypothetical protein